MDSTHWGDYNAFGWVYTNNNNHIVIQAHTSHRMSYLQFGVWNGKGENVSHATEKLNPT